MTLSTLLVKWHLVHRHLAVGVRLIGVVSVLGIFLRDVNLVTAIESFLLVLPVLIVDLIQICATLQFGRRLPFKLLRRDWINLLDLGETDRAMLLPVFKLSLLVLMMDI